MMPLAKQAGLYVHIPFCQRKCPYCSFYSVTPKADQPRLFVDALRRQMIQAAMLPEVQQLTFASVFFGGGTPSMLAPELLQALLGQCLRLFNCHGDQLEITIEVNPGTIDDAGLHQLRRAGFNRLSIGIQSLDDKELSQLGRIHSRAEAVSTIRSARQAGFDNLSFDLMYGLPGQDHASWQQTLEQAMALHPGHLSLYELTVEEGTPLSIEIGQGQRALPVEDEVLAMMETIETHVSQASLVRYEISNYAIPGRECRHNLNYWHNGLYLGLGPGAVSHFGGQRTAAVADLTAYCLRMAAGRSDWGEIERLDQEAAFRETVIMGLRILAGVSITTLRQRFGIDLPAYYGTILRRLCDQDLVVLKDDQLSLSRKGLSLANQVMAELV